MGESPKPSVEMAARALLDAYSFYFPLGNPWGDALRAALDLIPEPDPVSPLGDPLVKQLVDDKIAAMVERFLSWKLPADFSPDGGISFQPVHNAGEMYEHRNEPTGTNLLNAVQAKLMILHMLGWRS